MITLKFSVNNQIMTRTDDAKIVSNSSNTDIDTATDTSEWTVEFS